MQIRPYKSTNYAECLATKEHRNKCPSIKNPKDWETFRYGATSLDPVVEGADCTGEGVEEMFINRLTAQRLESVTGVWDF